MASLSITRLVLLLVVFSRSMAAIMMRPSPLLLTRPLFVRSLLLLQLVSGLSLSLMLKILSSIGIYMRYIYIHP
uniref:Uncharacterized protein n=1 Tax=Arundo donax TaxID=35708 RepID=A0A0A9EN04_ARUDO